MFFVGRFYCTQEELGTSCILIAFTGDGVGIARTVIEHVLRQIYHLHSALRALL
jgi:hypothetical protein